MDDPMLNGGECGFVPVLLLLLPLLLLLLLLLLLTTTTASAIHAIAVPCLGSSRYNSLGILGVYFCVRLSHCDVRVCACV